MGEEAPSAGKNKPAEATAAQPAPADPSPGLSGPSLEAERRARLKTRKRERRHRRWRITEAGAAFAAFLLSLGVLLLGGVQWMRGSEVVVLQPETVLLYRDQTATGSALWLAVQTPMINQASADYGDVVVQAYVSPPEQDGWGPQFAYSAIIEYVALGATRAQAEQCQGDRSCIASALVAAAERQAAECERGARCIANRGMYVIERPKRLLDVPGGGSRSEHLAFQIEGWNCTGEERSCGRFQNFASSLAALRGSSRLRFRVVLQFHGDGRKVLTCAAAPERSAREILDYLDERGWAVIECHREVARA